MVSAETLLSYTDWAISFTFYNVASDKQFCDVISQNNKPVTLFSRRPSKPQHNYTTTEKVLLVIVECPKQFHGIISGYEINLFSNHKNMVYAATLIEYQRMLRWRLIIEVFGPNIQYITGVNNIVEGTISRFPYTSIDKYDISTKEDQCRANEQFTISRIENIKYCLQINILNL